MEDARWEVQHRINDGQQKHNDIMLSIIKQLCSEVETVKAEVAALKSERKEQ